MFLVLKVHTNDDNSCRINGVVKSSLNAELEKTVLLTLEKKIECEKHILKLNNTITQIIHEHTTYYAFLESRLGDVLGSFIVAVLLDDSQTYLELFQMEIKQYLGNKLNSQNIDSINLDWKDCCIMYLPRFIKQYYPVLPEIIFAAIQGLQILFQGISETEIEEINRFTHCFGILDSKEKQKSDNASVIIKRESNSVTCNLEVSSDACRNMAKDLCSNANPVLLKGLINDFILEVNRELNIVRRMLNKAVGDFYVNYQLYKYISTSDKRDILHYHLELNEDISMKEKEVLNLTMCLVKKK